MSAFAVRYETGVGEFVPNRLPFVGREGEIARAAELVASARRQFSELGMTGWALRVPAGP